MTGQIEFDTCFDIGQLIDLSLSLGILIQSAELQCRVQAPACRRHARTLSVFFVLKHALRARLHGVLVGFVKGAEQTVASACYDIMEVSAARFCPFQITL